MRVANDLAASGWYHRPVNHSRPKRYTNWYLRDWMASSEVSQSDLIERTGYSKTAISLLVNDRQSYTPEVIRDMALALNIKPFELLMHPQDAMDLRQLRRDALKVVKNSEQLDRTGTDG